MNTAYVKITSLGAKPVNIFWGRSVLPGYIALATAHNSTMDEGSTVFTFVDRPTDRQLAAQCVSNAAYDLAESKVFPV